MAADKKELAAKILEATRDVYREKGLKFTMDDIVRYLGISKKTIYTVFADKETLLITLVNDCFDAIKVSEDAVLNDTSLSTKEKLIRVLGVLPDGYKDIDFANLYLLKDKFPKIYAQVEHRLESDWERTILLIHQGVEEGVFREVSIPVFQVMLEATLEQFFQRDILSKSKISYNDALQQVVEILVDGIAIH